MTATTAVCLVALGGVEAAATIDAAAQVGTERVSVGPGGVQANGTNDTINHRVSISADGRYVAFTSWASNLVAGDTNHVTDVFVRDRLAGVIERVSVGPGGVEGNGGSIQAAISADGRYVAFTSGATNLFAGDDNGQSDVFVRDRVARVTRRVSIGGSPSISAHGRYVAFAWKVDQEDGVTDIFVWDRATGQSRRVSVGRGGAQANGSSGIPSISEHGRYVAFASGASNLIAGDTNRRGDVFVRDLVDRVTRRVSVGPGGTQANRGCFRAAISADGQSVAFESLASNLVVGDTNGLIDVFVRNRMTGLTRRVSVGPHGAQGFDVSAGPAISEHGRFVAFWSAAPNMVAGDTNNQPDIFVRDRGTGVTRRVSIGQSGAQANGRQGLAPAISAGGRFVAFASLASNLVAGDTNGIYDVFVRTRW